MAPASLALIEAIKQLKKVKKEYDSYKHTRDDLKDKLHELKQAYKSKTPGIDGSDIEDLSDILENVNDEERYYKANIALAMANVEAKSLALIAQVAAAAKAASNWYTFGFSVGVAASVNGHKSKSNSNEVVSNPSNLSANNIKIQTPNDTTITGSNLSANNLIDINTNNLNINSSKNTYTSESKDKSIGGTMRYTMYGGGGGSAGLNYSTSSSDTESLTNNNSHLYSAKDMNINTANDATIKGANLRADERLNLKVGNNLNLESVRDKYAYNERGYSVGVGIGFSSDKSPNSSFANPSSTKATSTNANFSRSSSNTITKQTVLSSITANELNVEVGKNTHLKGSLLAAGEYDKDNTFIDNHNLNLKTNTLSYENLSNTSYAKGTNFSIGANYILEDKNNKDNKSNNNQEDKFTGLKSIDLSNHRNLSYSLSKNLATLGSGNIEIADKENSDDLTRLNRDTTKLTKDLVNTSISSNVDGSMDLRVLTKSGQKDIKDEFNTATAITKALNAIIETGEFNFNSEVKENVAQYEAGKLLGKELAQKLTDDSVTIEEKEALGNKFIQLFASMSGLDLDGISLRIIDDKFAKGKDDEKFLGHFNSGSIILNLAHIKNVDQFVSTLGHELKHAMDYKAGKFIPGDSKQDRYAKLKEDSFSDYLSKALNLQDSGINAKDAAINYIKNQSSLNTLLLNSYMFNGLDKSKGDNRVYLYYNKVVGIDKGLNDNQVVDLTFWEALANGYFKGDIDQIFTPPVFALVNFYKNGIFPDNVLINEVPDTNEYKTQYNLSDQQDFEKLRATTDQTYDNLNKDTKIVFMNGMDNTLEEAKKSVNLIKEDFGKNIGLINNATGKHLGILEDAIEWLPNYKTTKDVLNAYKLKNLSSGTTLITHSAGNEDIFKANSINKVLGVNTPYNLISVGSPKSATKLKESTNGVGANFIIQVNHENDPVANGILNSDANYEFKTLNDVEIYHPFSTYYHEIKGYIKNGQKDE